MLNSDILILGTGDLAPLTASGAIGTAVATVDKYSSMRLPQAVANLDFTIPIPTAVFIGQQFELINTGTTAFIVSGVQLGIGQAGLWTWSGTAWARIAPDQRTISGNTIALALSKPIGTVLTFDGFNVRLDTAIPTLPTFQISTVSGTRNVRWISSNEWTGGTINSSPHSAAPLALTTTFVTIGDPNFVGGERCEMTLLDESSGNHYRLTAWFYAPGLYSIIVDRIGLTTASILPTNLVRAVAGGVVDIGDAVVAGSRPITNNLNFATAVGSGTTQNATLTVTFATPLTDLNYRINCTLLTNTPASINNDNSLNWMQQAKSLTGFTINFREWISVGQNCSVDIECTVRS
jgi:hypothetical protein